MITKDMVLLVIHAMIGEISKKGATNKMVTLERIERALLTLNPTMYIPTAIILRELVKTKRVRYFKLDSGQLVYGFTPSEIERIKQRNRGAS